MKLKVIDGKRAELESKAIEAICLGRIEEANYLFSKLQPLPQPDLRLVVSLTKEALPDEP